MRIGLEFSKTGSAKYISHLDLQRAFSRAIRRSGLPVKLSEGFNPHYIVSFASALSLGIESDCECVEMVVAQHITPDQFLMDIARALPPGLLAKRAVRLKDNAPKLMAALCEAEYTIPLAHQKVELVESCVESILSRSEVKGIKVSGGVEKEIDIRAMIVSLEVTQGSLNMRLMASPTQTLKPSILLDVIEKETGPLGGQLKRTALYTLKDGTAVDLLSAFAV